MTELIAVFVVAALFALFGMLRPERSCARDCGACHGACHRLESNDEDA
jgi:hypothetical protein